MKLSRVIVLLFACFIITTPLTQALAQPYWVKPGVYITYIASRYDPYFKVIKGATANQIHTAELYYNVKDTLFRISSNNDTFVRFKFLRIERGYVTVKLTILMTNVTISTILLNGTRFPVFWNNSRVISEKLLPSHVAGFKNCVWLEVKLRKMNLSGTYRIRLKDGAVFGMNGTYYGRTFLWFNNSLKLNESISTNRNMTTRIWKMSPLNKSMMTYYKKFGPPLFVVLYSTSNAEFSQRIDHVGRFPLMEISFNGPSAGIVYDPSTGMAIYPTIMGNAPYADFYAVGIQWAKFTDEKSAYNAIVRKDKSWSFGLVLYYTNANLGMTEKIEYSRLSSPFRYTFYGSLTVLIIIAVLFKRRR